MHVAYKTCKTINARVVISVSWVGKKRLWLVSAIYNTDYCNVWYSCTVCLNDMYASVFLHAHSRVCLLYTRICACVCARASRVYACVYVCVHVCMDACMDVIHITMQTNVHTFKN